MKKYLIFAVILLSAALLHCQDATGDSDVTTDIVVEAPSAGEGFISVKQIEGRWYLVDGEGNPFISRGVNHVNFQGDHDVLTDIDVYGQTVKEKYKTKEKWAEATVEQMRELGFNSIGAWSSFDVLKDKIYFIKIVYMARSKWDMIVDDFFSEGFRKNAEKVARYEIVQKDFANNKNLIGYCLDNEMHWGVDNKVFKTTAVLYMQMDGDAPGKRAVVDFLRKEYNDDLNLFNRHWRVKLSSWEEVYTHTDYKGTTPAGKKMEDKVLYFIADQYYKVSTEIIRKYDKNHLILGNRFISIVTPKPVIEAAAKYVDVITVNHYNYILGLHMTIPVFTRNARTGKMLEEYYNISGKPLLITEFGFRAKTEMAPSTKPLAFPRLLNQTARGRRTKRYIERAMDTNYIVGYHVFQWFDQPAGGRRNPDDGENNNWGVVNVKDEVYEIYAGYLKEANTLGEPQE